MGISLSREIKRGRGLLWVQTNGMVDSCPIRSYGVDMSLEAAEDYRQLFFDTYPQFRYWQLEAVEKANLDESSESNLIKLTRHYDFDVYTHAMNYPIQSSAWEVLALAILYVDKHASDGINISHHVYDELALLSPKAKAIEAADLLQDAFYHGYHTCFPTAPDRNLVEIGMGVIGQKPVQSEKALARQLSLPARGMKKPSGKKVRAYPQKYQENMNL